MNATADRPLTQSAVYSDLYGTGLNSAGNTTFCDSALAMDRFRRVQVTRPAAG